jgi:AraC-like DNA-binding protein
MLTQSHAASGWAGKVYGILRRSIDQPPELEKVALELGIHTQTLRRRLDSEGTSFSEIKAFMRRDYALHLLGKQGLSIEEIAYRTGFSESSAFIRAFKTWTGVTPYTYRKGL